MPNSQKNEMEPIHLVINPMHATDEDYAHEGEEFGFVLKGEIVLVIGKKRYLVKHGQSFYFKPNKTHYIINKTQKTAELIWVSCPPNC